MKFSICICLALAALAYGHGPHDDWIKNCPDAIRGDLQAAEVACEDQKPDFKNGGENADKEAMMAKFGAWIKCKHEKMENNEEYGKYCDKCGLKQGDDTTFNKETLQCLFKEIKEVCSINTEKH